MAHGAKLDDLDQRDIERIKENVSHVEIETDDGGLTIVVHSLDFGVTIYQRFDATPEIITDSEGTPLLNVEVSRDAWATTYSGEGAGEASETAYEAAREYARKNTRSIIDNLETLHERQKQNRQG